MSAVLTGFTMDVIQPLFDPLTLVPTYLQTADAQAGQGLVTALIDQFMTLKAGGKSDAEIAAALLDTGNPNPQKGTPAILAESIVTMWYLGSWYDFSKQPLAPAFVVSQNAYVGGLAWKAMQSHPMGFSDFTFGYWAGQPPSLADFGVAVPATGGNNG
jgi:hypothetical protein